METITVEQVHKEFFTAADKLLTTFNEEERARIQNKTSRLSSIGFTGCADMQTLPRVSEAKTLSALIERYAMTHPNNKIITRQDVNTICRKYNLVVGELHRYLGFVPEKNLQEIEKFYHKDYNTFTLVGSRSFSPSYEEVFYTEVAANEKVKELNKKEQDEYHEKMRTGSISLISALLNKTTYKVERKSNFVIAAPIRDMYVGPNESVVNNEIIKTHVPDPVVLFPIENDCYLIVTAWGDEASDPLVVNEKMN